jgi:hypothetical protein
MRMLLRLSSTITIVVVAALGVHCFAQATTSPLADCTVAALRVRIPTGTTITGARLVEAAGELPQHCQVDGRVATPGNEVNVRLGLAQQGNGKDYFVGVGGLAGTIGSLNKELARGHASASTNTGPVSSEERWGGDHAREFDDGSRGTHVTATNVVDSRMGR